MNLTTDLTRILKFNGAIRIVLGSLIILLLVAGNLLVVLQRDKLLREDIAYQPPTLLPLQRLLYRPPTEGVEAVAVSQAFEDLSIHSTSEKGNNWISSQPNYTAVAGRPYKYQVRLRHRTDDARFSLTSAPQGMEIDSQKGLLVWTPETIRSRKPVRVELLVTGSDGSGSRQRFDLYVSQWPHPFGTIQRGRDLLAGLIMGSTWILLPGLLAAVISVVIGVIFGGYAGYYGGRIEAWLSYFANLFGTFPALLLIFLAGAIFHFRIYPIMIVVGLINFPSVAAAIRNKVIQMKKMDFIEAARELGLKDRDILWKDIIWYNTRPLIMTFASHGLAAAVLIEVTLSYLSLHLPVNSVSWGTMLKEGRTMLSGNCYWPVFFPLAAIIITIIGFYAISDGITRMIKVKNE